ncbi:MAG: hypothetical protein KAX78_06535, partial [Phycisphaerae bacterium]|nr:hypothetical protein [Phycisphaerae bacterium]
MSFPRLSLTAALAVGILGFSIAAAPAADKKSIQRDLNKTYEELTPSEHIALRAAAKTAYEGKKL